VKIVEMELPGLRLIEAPVFRDERGHFQETWSEERYRDAGIPGPFVQDNVSCSREGVLRGLHFQEPFPQGKLISVQHGTIWDVAVDVRVGSETFGRWQGIEISAGSGRQVYIPEGFAHGFVVLSEFALFSYKCTEYYHPDAERTVRWNDPELAIEWPVREPILSPRDGAAPLLRELVSREDHRRGLAEDAEDGLAHASAGSPEKLRSSAALSS
jgi:dTDP-4-dehydrorhamnose 3,5-epimerase